MALESINPANNQSIRSYAEFTEPQLSETIDEVHNGYLLWSRIEIKERAKIILKVAAALKDQEENLAKLMTEEMGKPIKQSRSELEKCIWLCEYYAENAEAFLKPETINTDAGKSLVSFEPMGVVLAVMPWNFPFWQVFRAAVPALLAGNTFLLKHAENVTGCALAIEALFRSADASGKVFRTLLIGRDRVAKVISAPEITGVTLTGSVRAGRAVAAQAGEALKKVVLELGGSDAYVVLADADVEKAAEVCAQSRMINSGQSCIAAKRFIVEKPALKAFEIRLLEVLKGSVMGDPMKKETTLGPMARFDLRDELHRQVQRSVELGAKLELGGEIPENDGAFYPATLLTNVKAGMPAYEEELFGPVASIITADDEADALRIANDSRFGLGAAVFTRDVAKGQRIAQKELQAGCCNVNMLVKSDPRLPFGGIKESGIGRELSEFGIREFVNIKAVSVASSI